MDITTIGSVTAYTGSLKTGLAVRGGVEAGSAGSRSDTAAFSAQARAAARLCGKKRPEHTAELAENVNGKEAVGKTAAENAHISVKPRKNGHSEIIGGFERGKNGLKSTVENAADTAAENAHIPVKPHENDNSEIIREFERSINELKEAIEKAVAENGRFFVKPSDNELSEISSELERRMNEIREAAEKAAAENAQKQTQPSPKDPENAIAQGVDKVKDKDGKTIAEMVKEQMEKLDSLLAEREYDKAHDSRLSSIKAKMRTGRTLTPTEQQYLAAKDPDGYSTFQQIESSRRMYRCSLSACRTRDEVNSMRLSNALSALSAYRKAIRNGGDGSAVAGLNAALDNEIRSFMGTSEYRRLPTVAECNKFDRDLAKAKRNEREKKLAEKRRQEAKRKKTLAARKLAAKRARYKKTPGDGKLTVAQVMSSPTAKKVLASRAKRTYCGCACAADLKGVNKLYSKA